MSQAQPTEAPGTFGALLAGAGWGFATVTFVVPVLAAVAAVALGDLRWLNLVHVVSAALWAGATVFVGVILGPTLNDLDPETRGQVNTPMIPKNICLFAGVALATLITGPVLATRLDRIAVGDPLVAAAFLIGAALLLGGAYLVYVQAMIYRETGTTGPPDIDRVAVLGARIGQLSPVMVVLQLAILVDMALLVTG